MRTICIITGILLLAAGMASAVMTTITVLGPDQQPVAGAKVYVVLPQADPKNSRELVTDAVGRAQVELELGNNPSRKMQPYAIIYRPGMGLAMQYLTSASVTVQLSTATTVNGKVVDAAGAPVAGVKMCLEGVVDFTEQISIAYVIPAIADAFTAVTAADGSWRLGDLPDRGTAFLALADPRFVREQCNISIAPPEDTPVVTIAQPGAVISGRVVTINREPVAGVNISARAEADTGNFYATTASDADGRYRMTGLPTGSYTLLTPEFIDAKWLAKPVTGVTARAGEDVTADIVVQKVGIIAGRVLDKATHLPVGGSDVVVKMSDSADTDFRLFQAQADGSFTFPVFPGNYLVKIGDPSGNNLATINYYDPGNFRGEVRPGETKTVTLYTGKGKSLTGTAVDEQGKPIAKLWIVASILCGECGVTGCNKDRKVEAWSDARGKFTLSGLKDGPLLLKLPDDPALCPEWTLNKPLYIAKPGTDPVTFSVQHAAVQGLIARVLDTDGKPVAGVEVMASVSRRSKSSSGVNSSSSMTENLVTDALGRYTITCGPKDTVQLQSIRKDGYRQVRLGVFSNKGGVVTLGDSVLAKMDGTLSGMVVGIDGTPLADVTVVSLEGGVNVRTKTRTDGAFSLTGIPRGDTTVLAVSPTLSGLWTGKTGATGVTITVRPQPKEELTVETLLDAWAKAGCPNRIYMAELFLNEGLDKALQVCVADGRPLKEIERAMLLQSYANSYPAEAAKIAAAQLDLITMEFERFTAASGVGIAVAKIDPVLAEHCYAIAKMYVSQRNDAATQCERYSRLVELARLLGHDDDVNIIMAHLIPTARSISTNWMFVRVVRAAATISPQLAQQVWEGLPDDIRQSAIAEAIPLIAKYDAAAAERLQVELTPMQLQRLQWNADQACYTPAVLRELAKTDPAAALTTAKAIPNSALPMRALVAVLPYQPRDVALRECRAQFDTVFGNPSVTSDVTALTKMLRCVYNLDPEAGRALYPAYARKYIAGKELRYLESIIPAYAYYAAPIDPVMTRIWLEMSFVSVLEQGDSVSISSPPLYPQAMMAFDQQRALTMTGQLGKNQWRAYLALMRYLRASDEERLWNLFEQN